MSILTQLLTQFIFRLSFGLAFGMALTSPRRVTSGYFRNHLYVLLGLNSLATMVALGARDQLAVAPPLTAAICSYLGSALWLYEKPRAGRIALVLVSAATLWGALSATDWPHAGGTAAMALAAINPASGGLVLGLTLAAMFLGHWYLNSPTMALEPLERLVRLMGAAICLRAALAAVGLALNIAASSSPDTQQTLFLSLRWLAGIIGPLGLVVMTSKTLKIPNTQSATGILYVAVITTFLGELTSQLLSVRSEYPM